MTLGSRVVSGASAEKGWRWLCGNLQIQCNPYQNDAFAEIENLILKFMQNLKGLWLAKTILKKKSKGEGLKLPVIKRTTNSNTIKL